MRNWSYRHGITRHYSTLAHSRTGPIKEIARRLGISRNTTRRPLRSGAIGPAYAERRSARAIEKYASRLSALLKTEAAKSRMQRRTLKQIHEDLKELGFKRSNDRVAAFARTWREGQSGQQTIILGNSKNARHDPEGFLCRKNAVIFTGDAEGVSEQSAVDNAQRNGLNLQSEGWRWLVHTVALGHREVRAKSG